MKKIFVLIACFVSLGVFAQDEGNWELVPVTKKDQTVGDLYKRLSGQGPEAFVDTLKPIVTLTKEGTLEINRALVPEGWKGKNIYFFGPLCMKQKNMAMVAFKNGSGDWLIRPVEMDAVLKLNAFALLRD